MARKVGVIRHTVRVSPLYLGLDGGTSNGALLCGLTPSLLLSQLLLLAMLSVARRAVLGEVRRCAITILYEMVFIDPS